MNIKELMDRVLFALSVPKCVCCKKRLDYGQKAFCPECYSEFVDFKTRNCSICAKQLNECSCVTPYLKSHFVKRVVKCYRYIGRDEITPPNALIYSLKRDNREDVLSLATDELQFAISNSIVDPKSCIFTNVPRRKGAIVEYGIDHSELLARELAKRFGARYLSFLTSNAKRAQKSLRTEDRLKNAEFEIIRQRDLSDKEVIIVDDIITSGASMASAATLIRSMGCKNITAAAIAIAYKDQI